MGGVQREKLGITGGSGICFRPRVQQDSAGSCVPTVHGDDPGWCEESSALPLMCRSVGSVPPDGHRTEGGSEPLMCPQLPVMAGATAGVQVADRNLDPGYFSPRSSSAEHLEVDTRFPFSPPGSGALRDVAYLEGCLFSAQVKCRMGVTFLRRSESEPAVLSGSAIPGIVLAGSLSAVITSVFPRLLV